MNGGAITVEQLARLSGEQKKRLLAWQALGILGDTGGAFRREDAGRARLVHDLLHRGLTAEAIARAATERGSLVSRYLEDLDAMWSRPVYDLDGAAAASGLDPELVRRLIDAGGIHQPGDTLTEDDVEYLKACGIAITAGYPEDALEQLLRVYADAMERVAEAEIRTTHFHVHRRLRAGGLAGSDLTRSVDAAAHRLESLAEPAILYFHRKGVARARWEDMLTHVQEDLGVLEKGGAPGQMRRCVMFVDLANFTPLAEAMGDIRAADTLERFAAIPRANVRCHGRIVKQIGDAFMVVFPESVSAVSCALEIGERASLEPQFPPVRAALHWGSILYREGDYVGSNVNLASRLAAEAGRHQVLVTAEVRRKAKALPGVEFIPLGKRKLKGLRREVEVFDARLRDRNSRQTETDPVCGIELALAEVAARLTLDGRDRAFCSDDCLRKFVKEPEKYPA